VGTGFSVLNAARTTLCQCLLSFLHHFTGYRPSAMRESYFQCVARTYVPDPPEGRQEGGRCWPFMYSVASLVPSPSLHADVTDFSLVLSGHPRATETHTRSDTSASTCFRLPTIGKAYLRCVLRSRAQPFPRTKKTKEEAGAGPSCTLRSALRVL
jgi:hypothetical protein